MFSSSHRSAENRKLRFLMLGLTCMTGVMAWLPDTWHSPSKLLKKAHLR